VVKQRKAHGVKKVLSLALATITLVLAGCTGFGQLSFSGPEWLNFIAPLEGSVQVVFINETAYKVSTYWGTYNNLDARHGVTVTQVELAAGGQSTTITTVPTTRKLDVAGAYLRRAAQIGIPANTDPSLIPDAISFTDANGTTVGTAPAGMFLLGADYSSNNFIEIHFKPVPGTTDQFTVVLIASPLTTTTQ
jgi:hypothetical protein